MFAHNKVNRTAAQSPAQDSRLYCQPPHLVKLQAQAQSFSLLPHLMSGSRMSGRHQALFRGRGLKFEELRHYQQGDDIRNMDWKTTFRVGKPYVRSYTEEKDRNVMVVVDQRPNMFFSSLSVMKSVVAAETAALCAWQTLKQGDRVGFLFADCRGISAFPFQRSQAQLIHRLKHLAQANQSLSVDTPWVASNHFSHIVAQLKRISPKAGTVIIVSDWIDATQNDITMLKQLQAHNDLLCVMVSDPLEQALPSSLYSQAWVVGDGHQQISIQGQLLTQVNKTLADTLSSRRQNLSKIMHSQGLPLIELDTSGDHLSAFKRQVGGRG